MFDNRTPLPSGVRIRPADWPADEPSIAVVRRKVFIEEQGVPEVMEWEDLDSGCDWFVAEAGGETVAIVRLTPDGRVGRMAVLPEWRRKGIGAALLTAALDAARKRELAEVELHAQTHAVRFYQRFGFVATGPAFDEAGIPHRHMRLNLER
jgi:predicted GNAT family N-acyltransferase